MSFYQTSLELAVLLLFLPHVVFIPNPNFQSPSNPNSDANSIPTTSNATDETRPCIPIPGTGLLIFPTGLGHKPRQDSGSDSLVRSPWFFTAFPPFMSVDGLTW